MMEKNCSTDIPAASSSAQLPPLAPAAHPQGPALTSAHCEPKQAVLGAQSLPAMHHASPSMLPSLQPYIERRELRLEAQLIP